MTSNFVCDMEENVFFTPSERELLVSLYRVLWRTAGDSLMPDDRRLLREYLTRAVDEGVLQRDNFGLNPIIKDMQTAQVVVDEIGMRRASVLAIMLHGCVQGVAGRPV